MDRKKRKPKRKKIKINNVFRCKEMKTGAIPTAEQMNVKNNIFFRKIISFRNFNSQTGKCVTSQKRPQSAENG